MRPGAREARVDGRFVVGDDELVLSRVVPADGRSRAYVDGRPATVAALADAASGLVDLHGQHDHQSLLAGPTQRAALDAFGSDRPRRRCARRAPSSTEIDAELAALGGATRERAREIDLLRFQVAELDAAALDDPDEDDAPGDAARTCSPTPPATARPARRRSTRSPTTAGRATPSPRRSSTLAVGRRSSAAADRLAAVLAELDDVVGRAARRRRGDRRGPRAARGGAASAASCCATCVASTATTSPR